MELKKQNDEFFSWHYSFKICPLGKIVGSFVLFNEMCKTLISLSLHDPLLFLYRSDKNAHSNLDTFSGKMALDSAYLK